jgi:hypothetical protein
MQIIQLQLRYVPVQDRLLLLINLDDQYALSLQLTRRLANPFFQALLRFVPAESGNKPDGLRPILPNPSGIRTGPSPDLRLDIPFRQPSRSVLPNPHPDGELVTEVSFKSDAAAGEFACQFMTLNGQSIDFRIKPVMAKGLCDVMRQTMMSAQWGLGQAVAAALEPVSVAQAWDDGLPAQGKDATVTYH